MLTAIDITLEGVATATPDSSMRQVMELLLDEDVSSLPIVDENGRMVGMVTESVLLVAAYDLQIQTDPVSLHMQRHFIYASPEEPLGQLVEKFLLHRVRHFPVINDRRFIGIVTRRELLKAVLGREKIGVIE